MSAGSTCNRYPVIFLSVSAVGTGIGRRTSSRRATSDAGGARLSEAGESGQLTEQERQKEKHESETSSSAIFFCFYSFYRDSQTSSRIPGYSFDRKSPHGRIQILFNDSFEFCLAFLYGRSRWKKKKKKKERKEREEILSRPDLRFCPTFT